MTEYDPSGGASSGGAGSGRASSGGEGARLTSDELAALSAGPARPLEERPAVATRHEAAGSGVPVEETTGTAAAEASGKTRVDNDAPAEKTSGSG